MFGARTHLHLRKHKHYSFPPFVVPHACFSKEKLVCKAEDDVGRWLITFSYSLALQIYARVILLGYRSVQDGQASDS